MNVLPVERRVLRRWYRSQRCHSRGLSRTWCRGTTITGAGSSPRYNITTDDMYKKGMFNMYYVICWTAQSALHFTPWQTCSFRHQLDFSGKHSIHAAITREYFYFIQPSELRRHGENKNAQISKRYKRGCEIGLSRLRVRHSTAELPRAPQICANSVWKWDVAISCDNGKW